MSIPHVYNPRNPHQSGHGFRKLPQITKAILPLAIVFVIGGAAYAIQWSNERRANPCVDCKRQKEIADEFTLARSRPTADAASEGWTSACAPLHR
jgi:hypothetical protein